MRDCPGSEGAEQDDAEQLGVLVQTWGKAESLMGCRKEQQQEEFLGKGGRIGWEIKETFGGGREGGGEGRKQVSNSDKMDSMLIKAAGRDSENMIRSAQGR